MVIDEFGAIYVVIGRHREAAFEVILGGAA